jgi:hypothetical protein
MGLHGSPFKIVRGCEYLAQAVALRITIDINASAQVVGGRMPLQTLLDRPCRRFLAGREGPHQQ